MLNYIIRRSFYSFLVILGVLLMTFCLFNLASGDPAAAVLGKNARPEEVESLRREMGADLPLFYGRRCATAAFESYRGKEKNFVSIVRKFPAKDIYAEITTGDEKYVTQVGDETHRFEVEDNTPVLKVDFFRMQKNPWNSQFFRSLGELVTFHRTYPYVTFFNFGRTINTQEPIREVLLRGMGPSLSLMLPIFIGELLFGILLALPAVAFIGHWPDRLLLLLGVAGMSLSYLVAIIFGQWFFGYYLEWFPVWGYGRLANYGLPILVGVLCGIGSNLRFFRTVFADELRREYLRTAVAKGVSPAGVYLRHLLRNGAVQIITRASAGLPFLFTGSLLLESFFGIPGLGFAGIEALRNSDIQLLKALVVTSALLFVFINLLADLAYAWADPRIKLE